MNLCNRLLHKLNMYQNIVNDLLRHPDDKPTIGLLLVKGKNKTIVGYSLDAQKSRMKSFCEFNDYVIVGEYEDAGKSGKSVEGRVAFKSIMQSKVSMHVETVCLLSWETGRHAKDYIKVGIDAEEYYAIKNASRD